MQNDEMAVCRYCGTKYESRAYAPTELAKGNFPPPPSNDMAVHEVFCKCFTCKKSGDGMHPCKHYNTTPVCDHYMAHPGRVERMASMPGPTDDETTEDAA